MWFLDIRCGEEIFGIWGIGVTDFGAELLVQLIGHFLLIRGDDQVLIKQYADTGIYLDRDLA